GDGRTVPRVGGAEPQLHDLSRARTVGQADWRRTPLRAGAVAGGRSREQAPDRGGAPYRRRADNEPTRGSLGADPARWPQSRATGPRLRQRQPRRHRLRLRRGTGDDPPGWTVSALGAL